MVGFMDDVFVSVKQIARTFHSSLCRTNEKKGKKEKNLQADHAEEQKRGWNDW